MKRMHAIIITAILITFSIGPTAPAAAKVFRTIPNDEKNVVQFISNATLERIVGRTNSVSGSVNLGSDDLSALKDVFVEVDLRRLDTGIAMRNQDMRTNYLETDEYPKATFRLTKVLSADQDTLSPDRRVRLVVEGDFTVHGVSKTYQIPVTLTYSQAASNPEIAERLYGGTGNLLSVTAEWSLKLADHGIIRPSFLFMRLAEEQQITVAFVLTDILPEQ